MKISIYVALKMAVLLWAFLLVSTAPLAADYSVRQVEGKSGQCYSKNKRISNARFCHNCRKSGGDNVRWKFRVYCEGKATAKIITVPLSCKQSTPEEGEQLRTLYESASEFMEDNLHSFSSFRECKYGGWPKK